MMSYRNPQPETSRFRPEGAGRSRLSVFPEDGLEPPRRRVGSTFVSPGQRVLSPLAGQRCRPASPAPTEACIPCGHPPAPSERRRRLPAPETGFERCGSFRSLKEPAPPVLASLRLSLVGRSKCHGEAATPAIAGSPPAKQSGVGCFPWTVAVPNARPWPTHTAAWDHVGRLQSLQ